mmetsp:Transcript_13861/g.39452  ORF Transcript_13861/g.39452 Transcript_13861/m.39452 type:complete len:217 (-) Transcript_13861:1008-1658(-)
MAAPQLLHCLVGAPSQLQGDVGPAPLVGHRPVTLQADACGSGVGDDADQLVTPLESAALFHVDHVQGARFVSAHASDGSGPRMPDQPLPSAGHLSHLRRAPQAVDERVQRVLRELQGLGLRQDRLHPQVVFRQEIRDHLFHDEGRRLNKGVELGLIPALGQEASDACLPRGLQADHHCVARLQVLFGHPDDFGDFGRSAQLFEEALHGGEHGPHRQ